MSDEQVVTQATTVETPVATEQEAAPAEQPQVAEQKPEPTELEKKLQAAEREAERHRKRAEYWMNSYQQRIVTPTPAATEKDLEPKVEDFADTLEYAVKRGEWAAREAIRQNEQRKTEEAKRHYEESRQQEFVQEVSQRITEAADSDPQVWASCNTLGDMGINIAQNPILTRALVESDNFSGIAKHLAANPQEAMRLLQMPTIHQVKEVARLEHKISTQAAPPPPPLRTSQAPPPVKPLSGTSSSTGAIDRNDPNISLEDFLKEDNRLEKLRRKQGKA